MKRHAVNTRSVLAGHVAVWTALLIGLAGCGSSDRGASSAGSTSAPGSNQGSVASAGAVTGSTNANSPPVKPDDTKGPATKPSPTAPADQGVAPKTPARPGSPAEPPRRSLADLVPLEQRNVVRDDRRRRVWNEAEMGSVGLRKLEGKYVTIYTDLPSQPAVDDLPNAFDAAIPRWCAYFEVDPARLENWNVSAFIMRDKDRFRRVDALPGDLPAFANGFQRGDEVWLNEQPSDYYRRHLLLHEGTHAFMSHWLAGYGPPWYMEGMAELFATHRWADRQLKVGFMPRSADEAPDWGRIRIIQNEYRDGRGKQLDAIFHFDSRPNSEVEAYGWCWGAAMFLERNPRSRSAFRASRQDVGEQGPEFTRRLKERLADEWSYICEDWQLFVAEAEYGYDVSRASVNHRLSVPVPRDGTGVTISSDRGWQSTGLRLERDKPYRIGAIGRYEIASQPKTWMCEPGGVTIRYYRGHPLGMLLGAVRPDDLPADGLTPLANPLPIGTGRTLVTDQEGTLYVKINEPSAELADNRGEIEVHVFPQGR